MEKLSFSERLLAWYNSNKRDLPWRNTRDPYQIWLSEIILQQTRVAQGMPYYYKILEKYPNLDALAKADEEEVLSLWQGLGYYSRARNMHFCAKTLQSEYQGIFPKSYSELKKLKGIGDYTAAAIASIAYKEPVPVIDGNVYRVLGRFFGIEEETQTAAGKKKYREIATQLIPQDRPDIFNQAIMEFGALHCLPAQPKCESCVFRDDCFARIHGLQKRFPQKKRKAKIKNRFFNYLIFQDKDMLYLKKRNGNDIWQGLYDFYNLEKDDILDQSHILNALNVISRNKNFSITYESAVYKHVLTHQHIFAKFFIIDLGKEDKKIANKIKMSKYSLEEIKKLPKPILISNFLNQNYF